MGGSVLWKAAKWLKGCIFSPDIKEHLAREKTRERAASVSLELPERLIKIIKVSQLATV